MNFKTLTMSAVIAGTVAMGATVAANPASALELNFGGTNRLLRDNVAVGGTSVLDFKLNLNTNSNNNAAWGITANRQLTSTANINNPTTTITPGTGTGTLIPTTDSVFGNLGSSVTLKDLALKKTGADKWELQNPLANFITQLGASGAFNLDTFILTRTGNKLDADYTGTFVNIGPQGIGTLTSQGNFISVGGTSFSSTVTAVPTPALLPGLLGLGVAALRKRKAEAEAGSEG